METVDTRPLTTRRVVDERHTPHSLVHHVNSSTRTNESNKLFKLLRNPLTLVLLTWLVMAILLWWEVVNAVGQ